MLGRATIVESHMWYPHSPYKENKFIIDKKKENPYKKNKFIVDKNKENLVGAKGLFVSDFLILGRATIVEAHTLYMD